MSAAIASSTPKKVRYSSTSLLRLHARCPGVRTPTLIMSLCTSIPATRSYITLISLSASCHGSSRTTGKTRRLPEPQDQYRRLTHAHAAATGGTRHGAPAADFSTASSGPKRIGDGRQHASIKHRPAARPRQLIRHAAPQPPQPPQTPAAKPSFRTQFRSHGSAAQRRMDSFQDYGSPYRTGQGRLFGRSATCGIHQSTPVYVDV